MKDLTVENLIIGVVVLGFIAAIWMLPARQIFWR